MRYLIICILLIFVLPQVCFGQASSSPIKGTFVRGTLAFGSITNNYTTILVNTKKLVYCTLVNATDTAITWDDSTSEISESQPAYSKEFYDWGGNGRYVSTTIRVKYTLAPPTVGNVYINCQY